MKVRATTIPDVLILSPKIFQDERGFLAETYQKDRFRSSGIMDFVQENHSASHRGTLRGLHYQIKQPQGKLVRVLQGEIIDVAVDIRRYSDTYGEWVSERLDSVGMQQMWIPPGFAHGFYVLSEWAEIEYKLTDFYAPQWQRTIKWDDPSLAILWPINFDEPLILSERDQAGTAFADAEVYTSVDEIEV